MVTRVSIQGDSAVVVLDQKMMAQLGITRDTDLSMSVSEGRLVIEPMPADKRRREIAEISKKLIVKNEELLRRLAK